ncbi:hypothetical protein [Streptococcus dentiloxodontae]
MAFVREVIPEEYWDMLKELGVYNKYTHLIPWIADKDRGIYMWTSRFADREDRTTDHILIWQNQVIYLNVTTVRTKDPIWNEETRQLLEKGVDEEAINEIRLPKVLANQEKELFQVIGEAFRAEDEHFYVKFRKLAQPIYI